MSECHGFAKAYQHPDVRIGWAPYVAVTETEIRSNPGGGTLLKSLIKGGGVGYQSVRNPTGSLNPELRLPVHVYGEEYAWVYSRAGTITGWIRLADIAPDPNAGSKSPLRGPGGFDFEIGNPLTPPLPKRPSGCGSISKTKPLRRVASRETYLRYSPRGTAYHYLHKDDIVRLLLVDGPHGFGFCEVVEARQGSPLRPGTRGWIQQMSLAPLVHGPPGP
jgi:hypothetical protein